MTSPSHDILLIRHDVSVANIDPSIYTTMPDHVIPLVELESKAVQLAAAKIKSLGLRAESTCSWSSPYVRCRQTEAGVLKYVFGEHTHRVKLRESFLLREQEFGDWDNLTDEEAQRELPKAFAKRKLLIDNEGRFYYRYPNGESRADVVQRVINFVGKVNRSDYRNHLVFLHGVTQRAFRMAWLNYSVDWFEDEPNPPNVSILRISRGAHGWEERWL